MRICPFPQISGEGRREVFAYDAFPGSVEELVGDRKRAFKDGGYGALAEILQRLATARRLEIADLLAQRSWTVEEVAQSVASSPEEVQGELSVLMAIGLAEKVDDGFRLRGIAPDLLVILHRLARESAAVQAVVCEFVPPTGALSKQEIDMVMERVAAGDALLLDVRPTREHRAGSAPGAISVPLDALDDVASKLPDGVEVLTMCRGPLCCWAEVAASKLRDRGVPARAVPAGPHELRSRRPS